MPAKVKHNKKRTVFLIIAAVTLALIIWFAVTKLTATYINYAQLTSGFNSDDTPIDIVAIYPSDAESFIALAYLKNMKEDTQITFRWFYETSPITSSNTENTSYENDIACGTLTRTNEAWQIGNYSVEIYIDGEEKPSVTLTFSVENY
jgi:hypothetical protein